MQVYRDLRVLTARPGREDEAMAQAEEADRRYGDAAEPEIREMAALALGNKGVRLGELGRPEEEIAVQEEIGRRYGDATEPDLRLAVARALVNKGWALGELGRFDEEISVYDEVDRRFLEIVAIAGAPTSDVALAKAAGLELGDSRTRLGSLRAAQLVRSGSTMGRDDRRRERTAPGNVRPKG